MRTVDEKWIDIMNSHQRAVTDAVREQIARHMPKAVAGEVGRKIAACLDEVREYHWKERGRQKEHWGYELVFMVDGDPVVFNKQFTLDRIVTDQTLADGTYAIPYSNILGVITLTEEEALLLATAI